MFSPPIERIKSRVTYDPDTGCWIARYPLSLGGYRRIKVAGKIVMCHRVTYEHYKGPIPDGFDVDHLCHNPACTRTLRALRVNRAAKPQPADI